jgi:hypothetical protein
MSAQAVPTKTSHGARWRRAGSFRRSLSRVADLANNGHAAEDLAAVPRQRYDTVAGLRDHLAEMNRLQDEIRVPPLPSGTLAEIGSLRPLLNRCARDAGAATAAAFLRRSPGRLDARGAVAQVRST